MTLDASDYDFGVVSKRLKIPALDKATDAKIEVTLDGKTKRGAHSFSPARRWKFFICPKVGWQLALSTSPRSALMSWANSRHFADGGSTAALADCSSEACAICLGGSSRSVWLLRSRVDSEAGSQALMRILPRRVV